MRWVQWFADFGMFAVFLIVHKGFVPETVLQSQEEKQRNTNSTLSLRTFLTRTHSIAPLVHSFCVLRIYSCKWSFNRFTIPTSFNKRCQQCMLLVFSVCMHLLTSSFCCGFPMLSLCCMWYVLCVADCYSASTLMLLFLQWCSYAI